MAAFTAARNAVNARGFSEVEYQLPQGGAAPASADTRSLRNFAPVKPTGRVVAARALPAISRHRARSTERAASVSSLEGFRFGS